MNLFKLGIVIGVFFALSACVKAPQQHDEREAVAVTQWTERTELFMEYRTLIAKKETAFAVHLTDLTGFQAVNEGAVTLIFKNGQDELAFTAEQPTSPGIFRPLAKIPSPGKYQLTLLLKGKLEDKHEIGEVEVYPNLKDVPHAHEEESSDTISFLKEQQWKGGFNVERVQEKELHEVIMAQGKVRAPLNAVIGIVAPVTGTLKEGPQGFPLMGSQIEKGQILAEVRSESENKITSVEAPVSGVVSVIHAAVGDLAEEGRKLFDVMDVSAVWIEARVYETDISKLNKDISALITLPNEGKTFESKKLVSLGGTLDALSRTSAVVFEVNNHDGILKIGSNVSVDIRTKKSGKGVVIPVSALVDEDGKMVAYVQSDGEAFEKRELELGTREGNWVQVIKGIEAGERVVTEGAYSIRLMSVSSQVPAHGHAH